MKRDEVIRCRDCVYFTRNTQRQDLATGLPCRTNWCEILMTDCDDDDFCSWAEREEEEP